MAERAEKGKRGAENFKTTGGAALTAALVPLSSSKIVVLGQNNLLAHLVNFFNIIKAVFGGMF